MSWSTAPVAPARKRGPTWVAAHTPPQRMSKAGWIQLALQRIGPLRGEGTLSATVIPHYTGAVGGFAGTGTLSATFTTNYPAVAAALSGAGSLTATAVRASPVSVAFSGSGALTVAINDGLSASVVPATAVTVAFGGDGVLAGVGNDGLTATVVPGTPSSPSTSADFGGAGTLSATVAESGVIIFALMGTGTLQAGVIEPIDGLVAAVYAGV